jgi:hypothetical protein
MTETETETEGRLFLLRLPQGKEKGVEGGRRGGGMWNVECGTLNVGAKEGQRLKKESRE